MGYKLKDLQKLVQAMSGAEKRHFSLLSSAFAASKNDPLYLQLFQTLCSSKTDISEISEKEGIGSYTPVKKRLFENVRKSLRMFHQEQSMEIRIHNYLSDIEILCDLNLPDQSLYLLRKAYNDAIAYEKFRLLLSVLEWERKLNIVLDQPTRSIKAIAEEEQEVLQKLMQIVHLENIYGKAKDMKRQHGFIRQELKEATLKAMEVISLEDCASQRAKFYFNFIHTLYHRITFNHLEAYQYSKALLQLKTQAILPNDYIDGVLEHVTECIQICRFREGLDSLELASRYIHEQKLDHLPTFGTKIFYYKNGYHLVIYNYMGDKERLAAAIKTAEEELKLHEESMSLEARQVSYANLMNAYVGIGNMQAADAIWKQLFHKKSKEVRREIYDELYLFRLFSLLESKVYEVLPYVALSTHRYYIQQPNAKSYLSTELKIADLLLKEYDFEDPRIKKSVLMNVKQILMHHISTLKGTPEFFQERYSFYVIWAERILTERPYYETAAEWYGSLKIEG